MGQKSQLYIRMNNIGKCYFDSMEIDNPNSEKWRDNVQGYVIEKEKHENWIKLFGNENTIIVGFHHQWLYGKSFVLVASMILNMNKVLLGQNEYEINPFSFTSWNTKTSGQLPRNCDSPIDAINYLQIYMSNLFDYELSQYARQGIERFTLLNGEDYENGDLITRFDNGDNNDGVLIVDMLENKYCFVDIYGRSEKLKKLNPVDAHAYLKTYYAETEEDCEKEEIAEKKPKFKLHTRINKKFLKRFKGFKTLSVQELISIFPVMENEINEANKIVTQL